MRVATGNVQLTCRRPPRQLADEAARFARGLARYRTGIDHEPIGAFGVRLDCVAERGELARHRVNFGLIQPTAQHAQVDVHRMVTSHQPPPRL